LDLYSKIDAGVEIDENSTEESTEEVTSDGQYS